MRAGQEKGNVWKLSDSVFAIFNDIDAAIAFYTGHLGFSVQMHPNEFFAILSRDGLRLMLNTPSGPGGEFMDGSRYTIFKLRSRSPTFCTEASRLVRPKKMRTGGADPALRDHCACR